MIFLNHLLSKDTPLYGGGGGLAWHRRRRIEGGDTANDTALSLPVHGGTHVDAPWHFDPEGKKVADYAPDFWVCNRPFLIEKKAAPEEIFSLADWLPLLEVVPPEADLLLVKTGFEGYRSADVKTYIFHGPGFAPEIGAWLRKNRRLKMIGFDFISLTSYAHRELGRKAHRAFLAGEADRSFQQEPILIIEDMKLSTLLSRPTKVTVLPLLYQEADGSPVTILAEC